MTTIISGAETQLVAILGAVTVNGAPLRVYSYEPTDGAPPFVSLYPPDIKRANVDTADPVIGRSMWDVEWVVRLYVQLTEAQAAQTLLKSTMEALIGVIDANTTLNGVAEDARIHEAQSGAVITGQAAPLLVYESKLRALIFV